MKKSTPIRKWDYQVVESKGLHSRPVTESILVKQGKLGWELVAVIQRDALTDIFYFKKLKF